MEDLKDSQQVDKEVHQVEVLDLVASETQTKLLKNEKLENI